MNVLARFALAASLLLSSAAHAQSLRAEDAWIRAAPPGSAMLAGYALLHNDGDAPLRIVSATSDAFGSIEFHRTVTEDGVSRMRPVEAIEVPPGGAVTLEPGGMHLMLMRPSRQFSEGERVVIALEDADGGTTQIELDVRRAAMDGDDGGHHGHH